MNSNFETKQSFKSYQINSEKPLIIELDAIGITFQRNAFDNEQTKKTLRKNGVYSINVLVKNKTPTDIQNLEIKLAETQGRKKTYNFFIFFRFHF